MHAFHTNQAAVLNDGCPECEQRGEDVYVALCAMDRTSFLKAWERAAQLQLHGLPDGQQAELKVLRALIGVQLNLERLGLPYGQLPTS